MNAIAQIARRIKQHRTAESDVILRSLIKALGQRGEFPLDALYQLDYESFELALDLLRRWRLSRYTFSDHALQHLMEGPGEGRPRTTEGTPK